MKQLSGPPRGGPRAFRDEGADDEVLKRVGEYIRKHDLLRPGDIVLVAVSGGPDSMALLHVLTRLRRPLSLTLHVLHVDHRLRAAAAADARFVRHVARAWGVDVTVVRRDVQGRRRAGESVMVAARRVRHDALRDTARAIGARRIAFGHHADDQAETVLLRLLRGAGTAGLGGIAPRRGSFIRPLLSVSRAAIESYCTENDVPSRLDESNLSYRYMRNRIRGHLLPLLEEQYNPNVRAGLFRTAALLREDDDLLDGLAADAYAALRVPPLRMPATGHGDGLLGGLRDDAGEGIFAPALAVAELRQHHVALQRRIVRHWLLEAGVDLATVTYDHVAALLRIVVAEGDGAVPLPGRWRVVGKGGRLTVVRDEPRGNSSGASSGIEQNRLPAAGVPLNVPGTTPIDDTRRIEATFLAGPMDAAAVAEASDGRTALLASDRLHPPLVVRRRHPGDSFRPLGLGGTKKLQDLFVDEKVPAPVRDTVPVVADARGILWVAGYRLDERAAVTAETSHILQLRIQPL